MLTIHTGQMQGLQLMLLGKLDLTHRKMELDPYLSSCTKRDWDLDLQTWNCCRKKSGVNFNSQARGWGGGLAEDNFGSTKIKTTRKWNQTSCLSPDEWIKKKTWCIYTMEYYLVVKCLKYSKWNLHINEWDWKSFTLSEVRANTTNSAFSLSSGDSGF